MNQSVKYKDELPLKTINRIRDILGDLGLLAVETAWKNSVEGFYSVSLLIQNTTMMTNGKGTSYEYALASAYGEMMERLQNQAVFRLGFDLRDEALKYMNFYYAPDEIYMSIDDVLNSKEDWSNKKLAHLSPAVDKQELLKVWQLVSYEDVPSDFIALPYLNLQNNSISHIPVKMISKMYMSNGMCAGNTAEEALVQGISEILERNVIKRVIREQIATPVIPRDYMVNFPKIDAMLAGIESSGNFNVIVKDCSLDKGFPVVAVICINKSDQSYFVKFGAHPVFEIAVERTLTELLQGQDIYKMMGVREFSYKNDVYDNQENMMGILVNGSGVYPASFFSGQFNYRFQGFYNNLAANNKELLSYLINLLTNQNYDIFVRDVSYLGFPSYHIIVPGLSEIEEIDDIKAITNYAEYNKVKRILRNSGGPSNDKTEEAINALENAGLSNKLSIPDLLQLPINISALPWYYADVHLFLMALYYRKKDMKNAYKEFNKFLKDDLAVNRSAQVYYKCVRDYLGTQVDKLNEKEAVNILQTCYPQEIVQGVIREFGDSGRFTTDFLHLKCWHCAKCPWERNCLYCSTENVYKKLKEQYAIHSPDQNMLKGLLKA